LAGTGGSTELELTVRLVEGDDPKKIAGVIGVGGKVWARRVGSGQSFFTWVGIGTSCPRKAQGVVLLQHT